MSADNFQPNLTLREEPLSGGGYVLRVQRLARSKTMIGMCSLLGLDEKKLCGRSVTSSVSRSVKNESSNFDFFYSLV